jgi:hypothetical protein
MTRGLGEEAHGDLEHPIRSEQAQGGKCGFASNAVGRVILDDLEERVFHRTAGKRFVMQETARNAADFLRAVLERLEERCLRPVRIQRLVNGRFEETFRCGFTHLDCWIAQGVYEDWCTAARSGENQCLHRERAPSRLGLTSHHREIVKIDRLAQGARDPVKRFGARRRRGRKAVRQLHQGLAIAKSADRIDQDRCLAHWQRTSLFDQRVRKRLGELAVR